MQRRLLPVSGPLFLVVGGLVIVGADVLHRQESATMPSPTTTGARCGGDRRGERQARDGAGQAARVVARYPAGAPVNVHYDPDRPQRAMLEVGASWERTAMVLLVGLATMGVGGLFLKLGRARPAHAGELAGGPARAAARRPVRK